MAKEVALTLIAEEDYAKVVNYLASEWGDKVLDSFVARFQKVISILEEDAGRYPFVNESKNARKCVVTKHNVIYFIETDDLVKIITVFDTRQDPDKLFKII